MIERSRAQESHLADGGTNAPRFRFLNSFSDDGGLGMRICLNALKIALAVLSFANTGDLKGQACQGCICNGSKQVHPVASPEECNQSVGSKN